MSADRASPDGSAPVAFDERVTASGHRIGRARLSRAKQRNALNREICTLMLEQLREWASDQSIVCVVLDGDGDKAMCAGGDVITAARHIASGSASRYAYGDALFPDEYRLVRLIGEYPKPLLSWAHGATMGAGMGLAVAASHRVVSHGVTFAMPEIQIGLFPDAGAGWFLNRTPAGIGLLVAMAGLVLNDSDACIAGLADWSLPFEQRDATYARLEETQWHADARADAATLATLLDRLAAQSAECSSMPTLPQRANTIRRVSRAPDPTALREALAAEATTDPWFEVLAHNLAAGSPFAAQVTFEHLRRCRLRSLVETLEQDVVLIKALIRRDDFVEGVRALLIDKDRRPAWSPSFLADVTAGDVARCFASSSS